MKNQPIGMRKPPSFICKKTGISGISGLKNNAPKNKNMNKKQPDNPCRHTSSDKTKDTDIVQAMAINQNLRRENTVLRLRLQHVRNQTFSESTKVLDSVMTYCDAKSKISKKRCTAGEDKDKFKCGNSGLCGGYTPGGWNKLRSMGLLKSNDMLSSDRFCENLTDPIKCPDVKCPEGEEKCLGRRESNNMERVEGDDVPGVPSSTAVRLDKRICGGMDKQNFRPSARLLGELAFQLERRMLDYVFGLEGAKKRRFYGYTVANICYMMEKESMSPDGQSDVIGRTEMTCRLRKLLCALEKYGYDIKIHADFSQEIINKYGLLPNPPDAKTLSTFQLNDPCIVASLISRLSKRQSEVHDLNILLNCLNFLSSCDGRTLFVW